MTAIAELQIRAVDKGKTYYESITRQAKGKSQYQDTAFSFENLEGYWDAGPNIKPIIGQWYDLELATKPKTGPNAKQGSLYMDIVRMAPVDVTTRTPSGADVDELFAGKPEPQQPPEKPNAGIAVEGVVQGHLEKLAVDLYIAERRMEFEHGQAKDWEWGVNYLRIREIRDAFYHQLQQKPIQHEHYCYEHETLRQKGNTGYGHRVDNGWCIEGQGVVLDSNSKETPDG